MKMNDARTSPMPPFDPDLDMVAGMTDDEMTRLFILAIEHDNREKLARGLPIAGYDEKLKKAFLEYPDGSREYADYKES